MPQRSRRNESVFDWSWRGIRWRDVLSYQHWGGLLLFIPCIVIIGISHWSFQERPVTRPALDYDATISNPYKGYNTIGNNVSTLYNWLCQIGAVVIIELLLFRRQHSLTVALTGMLHQCWCCAINFVIILAVAEITKPFSGRLRPDFLARCQPAELGGSAPTGPGSLTSLANVTSTGLGQLRVGQVVGPCTNPNHETVKDGRLSFPSGHASNTMSVAWFTSLYVMWSLYLRVDAPFPNRLHTVQQLRGWPRVRFRLVQEVWHALVYAFVLVTLCLSWFIGATRFWDNAHHVSDILGGFLLAIIFTTPFSLKAIGLHNCIKNAIDGTGAPGSEDVYGAGKRLGNGQAAGAPAGAQGNAAPILPVSSSQPPVGGALGAGMIGSGSGTGPAGGEGSHVALDVHNHGPAGPLGRGSGE